MVSPIFVGGIYVLIGICLFLLCSIGSPDGIEAVWKKTISWVVLLFQNPKNALVSIWGGFWNSWVAVLTVLTTMYAIALAPFSGFGLSKALFICANLLLFIKLCIADELHGTKNDRKGTGERASVIVIMAIVLICVSSIECGMVSNAEKGKAPTLQNILLATMWWRHETLAITVQPTVYKPPLHNATPTVKHHLSRKTTPCSMRAGTYYPDNKSLPGGPHLSRPILLLDGSYETAWSWRDDKYLLLFELAITNRGEESIVKDWELCLLVHGKPLKFNVGAVPSEGIALPTGEKISNEMTLTERAARTPIEHAHRMAGWVAFSVPADLAKELIPQKVGVSGAMSFKDYLDHTYSRDLVGNSEVPKAKVYVPGSD